MVIHSIAPRLKKHVYLGYLRKVFEPLCNSVTSNTILLMHCQKLLCS